MSAPPEYRCRMPDCTGTEQEQAERVVCEACGAEGCDACIFHDGRRYLCDEAGEGPRS
jgi:hypothetical protein